MRERGFNSPFEVCAIAHELSRNGVPTAYMRAIYMTGSEKMEPVTDPRRYDSHRSILAMDGRPVLREERNYVTIRGYFNGTDDWVATHEGQFCQPVDLQKAIDENLVPHETGTDLMDAALSKLKNLGYDGSLLEWNDLLMAIDPHGHIVLGPDGRPETRICNLELIHRC